MKLSKMYMPTLREVPAEAEIKSHQLLLRAGMMKRLVSGIYSYLPLGYRTIRKIEQVVREEMDRSGSQEILMSAVQPREIWEATGRWEDFGPEMFKLKDRHEREFCLGPTHEEYLSGIVRDDIKSYKQLPMNLYQIQTKYRDEKRPRFGLMRSREFIMKDAYSFDINPDGMKESYQEMWDAYDSIFTRLKMNFRVVRGDSGAMGGDAAHEFMAMAESGESLVAYCPDCSFAATDENAKVVYNVEEDNSELLELEKVHTPGATTIDDLKDFFEMDKSKFAKALVYNIAGETIVAIVPGDRELNEIKLINYLGAGEHEIEMADDETVIDISNGSAKGFTGPVGIKEGTRVLVDERITLMKNLVVGGNETDYHLKNANYGRDFKGEIVKDLLLVEEGDICPECGAVLKMDRGIEVGNIFQLGTKYSEGLDVKYLDENGKDQLVWMGSYGVGVSRTMAAIVEQYNDEDGIVWPLVVVPYHVIITIVNAKKEDQMTLGEELYRELQSKGIEVLFDDRDERAGVKFNDRDLIGIPIRITVGRDAENRIVEYSNRREKENRNISVDEIMEAIEADFESEGFKL